MYNDTITLFCSRDEYYYPTVLHNVDLNIDKSAIMAKYGEHQTDNARLHVKYTISVINKSTEKGLLTADSIQLTDNKGNQITVDATEQKEAAFIEGKEFVYPKEYKSVDEITFKGGSNPDFFWVGEWESEKVISDEEYQTSLHNGFYDYMNSTRDNVYVITTASKYDLIPHMEVLAK